MANATKGDPILRLENITVNYRDPLGRPVRVLADLSATVYDLIQEGGPVRPQIVAFVGPSGSGKTTLFRSIAGVEKPTSGSVLLGRDGIPVRPGMVGVVSQDLLTFEFLTVLENLELPARLSGMSKKQATARAKDFLQRFDLLRVSNLYPDRLSGGQRQRLAILRQLISSVPTEDSGCILLMDEPFSGLDAGNKELVTESILHVGGEHEKNTVIITSHDIRAALKVADTVWILMRDIDEEGHQTAATIHEVIDLVGMGLAWEPGITQKQAFMDLQNDIEARFIEYTRRAAA